jgi:hypothetical protein
MSDLKVGDVVDCIDGSYAMGIDIKTKKVVSAEKILGDCLNNIYLSPKEPYTILAFGEFPIKQEGVEDISFNNAMIMSNKNQIFFTHKSFLRPHYLTRIIHLNDKIFIDEPCYVECKSC